MGWEAIIPAVVGGIFSSGDSSGGSSGSSGTVSQVSEGGTASEYQDLLNLFKASLYGLTSTNPVAPGKHSGQFAYLRPEDIKYPKMKVPSTYKPSTQQSYMTPFQVFQPNMEGTWNGTSGWPGGSNNSSQNPPYVDIGVPANSSQLHFYTPVSGLTAKAGGSVKKTEAK